MGSFFSRFFAVLFGVYLAVMGAWLTVKYCPALHNLNKAPAAKKCACNPACTCEVCKCNHHERCGPACKCEKPHQPGQKHNPKDGIIDVQQKKKVDHTAPVN